VVWCNAYSEWAAAKDPDKTEYKPLYKKGENVIRTSTGSNAYNAVLSTDAPGYRLPSRKEWEFAARGGRPHAAAWQYTYAGSDDLDAVGWYTGNASLSTHQVGSKAPNTLGIYDMSGNVAEIIAESIASSNTGTALGGHFNNTRPAQYTVSSYAEFTSASVYTYGFRVAGPYQP
jgi:formylglycine-generating enzyme required for sulfatase activity